jgi:hypothetical protein
VDNSSNAVVIKIGQGLDDYQGSASHKNQGYHKMNDIIGKNQNLP